MSHGMLIASYISVFLLEFAAFGMVRATLLMSREADVPPQFSALLLPRWFPAVWLVRVTKWGILLFIAVSWNWLVAGVLLIASVLCSSILPIPYRVYIPSFRRRIDQIKSTDAQVGAALEAMLNSSEIHMA